MVRSMNKPKVGGMPCYKNKTSSLQISSLLLPRNFQFSRLLTIAEGSNLICKPAGRIPRYSLKSSCSLLKSHLPDRTKKPMLTTGNKSTSRIPKKMKPPVTPIT